MREEALHWVSAGSGAEVRTAKYRMNYISGTPSVGSLPWGQKLIVRLGLSPQGYRLELMDKCAKNQRCNDNDHDHAMLKVGVNF